MPQKITAYPFQSSRAILLQGSYGARKTTTALRLFRKPYIFDADENLSGPLTYIKNHFPTLASNISYDRGQVDTDGKRIPNEQQYPRFKDLITAAASSPDNDGIIIDSYTTLIDMAITDTMSAGGTKVMRIQDWGVLLMRMKQLVMGLKSGKKSIVFIAHERLEKDEISGLLKFKLLIPGAFGEMGGALFTDVWRSEITETNGEYKQNIQTMSTIRFSLKNSFELKGVVGLDEILTAMGVNPTT